MKEADENMPLMNLYFAYTLLRELHWLQIPERIQFRLCVLTYRCLQLFTEQLRRTLRTVSVTVDVLICLRRVAAVFVCLSLTRWLSHRRTGQHLVTVRSQRQRRESGMNGLLASVRAATSPSSFRQQLNTFLYRQCF